ncbi:MAG: DUF1501 domain-containing protein [Planctomycetota bacterium]
MNQPRCPRWEHHLSRRRLLGGAAAAAAGTLAFSPIAPLGWSRILSPAGAAELQQKRKQVLFIWIDGGMSQLESWDPKPGTIFGGPFRAIPTSVPGTQVSELLPRTAKWMHELTVVRSLCTKDNSHSAGVARIQRGDPKNRGVTYPFFGSAVANLLGSGDSGLPPYVWIKPGSGGFIHQDAGFLGPKYGALAFGDGKPPENMVRPESLNEADDESRNELREAANRRYAARRRPQVSEASSYVYEMARTLMRRQDLFDTRKFDPRDVERYGQHEFGRHMLQARKMLEAGVTFVKVNSYGWDTHGDNFNAHVSLMPRFDQAFAAMIEDLSTRGMLDNVLVIAMSEFGRTPRINGHVGRDHWPEAWSLAMAGCGLKRGAVVGATNEQGTWVSTQEHDIGHLFHTWFHCLGIDSKKQEYNNHGQPLPLAHDDCSVIKEALS